MADHADGSIIVDTEIDPSGFRAGSAELQRAIKSLTSKIESLGPTFQKALSGNTSALSTFDAKAAALETTISQLEEKLASLGNARVPTENYQWLTKEIEKAEIELAKLEEKQIKLENLGTSQSSQAWKSLQYDIDLTTRKVEEYRQEQEIMRNEGTAFQMGSSTAEFAQLEGALASAKERLAAMRSEAESAGQSINMLGQSGQAINMLGVVIQGAKSALSKISGTAHSIGAALTRIGKVGVAGFKKLVTGIKNAITHLKQFKSASGGAESAIGKLTQKLTGMWSMLKRMALRKILMSIITGMKESLDSLAQYSPEVNANLSALKSSLTQLKNSFATAFAPILTAVTPALVKLINYLSAAVTWVGKLIAALTGAKTFTKATAVQVDYAASLDKTKNSLDKTKKSLKKTKKEAEEAKRQLAGFDELNILSDNSSDSSDDNDNGVNIDDSIIDGLTPSDMFEEVPIESSITSFIDRLKNAFKNGDFAEIGRILGNKINEIFQKIHDFISWDNLGGKITKFVKDFAAAFNSLIYTIDWELIGDTFAEGINTIINTLYLLTTEIDWPALTGGIARSLSSLITGINWAKLGQLLSTQVRTLLQSIRSAVQNFDWFGVGKCVADGLNNIDWVGILSDLAGTVSDIIVAALDLLIGFADNLDWRELGRDIWNGLVGIVQNIDWAGIISKAFHLLGSALGGLSAVIVELALGIWEALKKGFENTKTYFNDYIEKAGGDVIAGLWQGIKDALKDVGNWIIENIWNPFVEGFKNAFGIHSPSTKMAEQGEFIISGLWNGVKNAWKSNSISEFFKEKFENIKTSINNTWNKVKADTSNAWTSIKSSLTEKWVNIKNTASTKFNEIKNTILTKGWSGVGSNIISGIGAGIDAGWSWLKDMVGNLAQSLLDKAKAALGIQSPSKLFRDAVGLNIGLGVGEGIESAQPAVLDSVTGMADAIATEMQNGDYMLGEITTGKSFEGSLVSFSDTITDSFASLLDRLQSIADNVTFSMPVVAKNGVIPYSVRTGDSNDGDNVSSAIEASNSELATIIVQAVSGATSAIVGAIQTYSGTKIPFDSDDITTNVIKEINRRTRMTGISPLR